MAHSDFEDDADAIEDLDFDSRSLDGDADADGDDDIDEDLLDAVEGAMGAEEAEEGDDETFYDKSDDGEEDEDEEDQLNSDHLVASGKTITPTPAPARIANKRPIKVEHVQEPPTQRRRTRSPSPAHVRRANILASFGGHHPRSYTVEAICAIPQPVPTHALASSLCMSHLLTGSDDGYIRDYDIFSAVNSKNFLSAPQRHHCGVIEGTMKAGQLRFWWENPAQEDVKSLDAPPCPVYSLAMHSDALWALAGTDQGHVNLFTVRHDPGRLCYVMSGHRGHVSALCLDHEEKGFFSACWDGEALQWDLNTGQIVRKFTSHGAQLAAIAVRPLTSAYYGEERKQNGEYTRRPTSAAEGDGFSGSATLGSSQTPPYPINPINLEQHSAPAASDMAAYQSQDTDVKSEASYDPLFDDEPDADGEPDNESSLPPFQGQGTDSGYVANPAQNGVARGPPGAAPAPKNAPPLFDSGSWSSMSPDCILTASIDGQVILWDKRVPAPGKGVGRLWMSEKTPPWCMSACWSANGEQVYAGRRNGTVDIWDIRQMGTSGPTNLPRLLKTLRNPVSSGVVSCVVAFPDSRHLACASQDNIRLWNVAEAGEPDQSGRTKSGAQFKIIPGHHGGFISQMLVDPAARFLVTASSNRGWHGDSTRTVLVHEIKHIR